MSLIRANYVCLAASASATSSPIAGILLGAD